ncbi:MAG: hypothetical protein ABI600_04990 [Luteolibacter sp.]
MNGNNFLEESGLVCGFDYHDRVLKEIFADSTAFSMSVIGYDGNESHLVFSGIYCCTIENFFPSSIILSIFIWKIEEVPDWIRNNEMYQKCLAEGPIVSRFICFMDSSFGAIIMIFFNSLNLNGVGIEL